MTESLRERCLLAARQAILNNDWRYMNDEASRLEQAAAALDAVLDVLEESADEWWDAWYGSSRDLYESLNDDHIRQLLSVLRGNGE